MPTRSIVFSVLLAAATRQLNAEEPNARVPKIGVEALGAHDVRYCFGDNEVHTQDFSVDVRYTNHERSLMKLSTGIDSAPGIRAAASLDELRHKRFAVDLNFDLFLDPSGEFFIGDDRNRERIVYLKPGESTTSTVRSTLVVTYPGVRKIAGAMAPGSYFAEVRVLVKVAKPVAGSAPDRARFSKSQWIYLRTQPIPLEVPPNPPIQQECS